MTIKYEETEFCKIHLEYNAPANIVKEKREQAIEEIFKESKKVAIKGFRKGQAGIDAVKMRFAKQIEESTKQKLVGQAMDDYTFETHAKTVFYPEVKTINLKNNQFQCEMIVMKKPDFELKQYKGFEIPKPHVTETSSEMVEKSLQQIRVANGNVQPYSEKDFVQNGDKVTMDMKCTFQGNVIEEFTKEGVLYDVGSGLYRDIDDNIQGMVAGEQRTFETLWDDKTDERATFNVLIHMGVKTIPHALDDELAKKVGINDFAQLRAQVEGYVSAQIKEQESKEIQQQLIQRLLNEHTFDVPNFLFEVEAEKLAIQFGSKLSDVDDDTRVKLISSAKNMVKISMILDSIREKEPEAIFSEGEILNHIRNELTMNGQDPQKFLVESMKSGRLTGIVAGLQQKATTEWLVKNCTIIE